MTLPANPGYHSTPRKKRFTEEKKKKGPFVRCGTEVQFDNMQRIAAHSPLTKTNLHDITGKD